MCAWHSAPPGSHWSTGVHILGSQSWLGSWWDRLLLVAKFQSLKLLLWWMASPPHSPSHILSPPINRVPLPAVPILAKTIIGIYQLVNGLISRVCKPNTCPCPACESWQSLVSIYFLIRLVSRQLRMRGLLSPPLSPHHSQTDCGGEAKRWIKYCPPPSVCYRQLPFSLSVCATRTGLNTSPL